LAAEIPHRREHTVRILRIEFEVGTAGGPIRAREHLAPVLARVRGLEQAAFVGVAPQLAGRTDPRGVAVLRMHDDLRDAFALGQAEVRPGVAAVG
jgi:hypothetical protein